jgi:hypothetical protein
MRDRVDLAALLDSVYGMDNKKKVLNEKSLCFFAINYFYACNVKGIFTFDNYLKIRNTGSLQSKIFECILSDIHVKNSKTSYGLNKNLKYHITLFANKAAPARKGFYLSERILANSLKKSIEALKAKQGAKDLAAINAKGAFNNDPLAGKLIDSVAEDDKVQMGGALLFLGLREGLTPEQKEAMAKSMTALATRLHLEGAKKAVEAYLNGNVRVYVNNGNHVLVNYNIEF